jgi:poly(3-hydroxybutyrate) depolymerase
MRFNLIQYIVSCFLVGILFYSCAPEANLSYYKSETFYKTSYRDSVYFFKFNTMDKKKVSGVFYSAGDQQTCYPQFFKLSLRKIHQKTPFIADTAEIYRAVAKPAFYPDRYKKELFQVDVTKNITFARVEGHWDSYITDNESYFDIFKRGITSTLTTTPLELKMDIYQPQNSGNQKRPLLLVIHGGAFYIGDKSSPPIVEFCRYFASLGYTTASINYRLGFIPNKSSVERTGYSAVQDAHAAMRFLVENRDKYMIDTALIFVCGTSAGAITTLNLAFMQNDSRPESTHGSLFSSDLGKIESSGNLLTNRFTIKAIGNMWGAINDLNHLKSAQVDVVSFHGDKDRIVPYGYDYPFEIVSKNVGKAIFGKMYGSYEIHKMLKKLNRREKLYTFEGFDHEPHVDSKGNLNSKHEFIKTNMALFFYENIVPIPIIILRNEEFIQYYSINMDNVADVLWGIEGGFIISQDKSTVRVIWKTDESIKTISVSGRYKNGASFFKTIAVNL